MTALLHLQTAACGRPSEATIAAVADHLRLEAAEGGYVAEEAVAPRLETMLTGVAAAFGHGPGSARFTTGATDSLSRLLRLWPLPSGAEVGVMPGEWGPNRELFADHDLAVRELAVDGHGVLDLEALERTLRDRPPGVVHLVALASHRALEQPVDEALVLCRAVGVPVWVDAAQAFAHRPTRWGADAVYAPARKWLDGARGVGFLSIAEPRWKGGVDEEASVASRVGTARAWADLDPDHVARREAIGARLREAVAEVEGWQLADPPGAGGALVGLRPTAGQDVEAEQRRLHQEHRILTTACGTWRAPGDMPEPLLRLAPTELTDEDVSRLTAALRADKHPAG